MIQKVYRSSCDSIVFSSLYQHHHLVRNKAISLEKSPKVRIKLGRILFFYEEKDFFRVKNILCVLTRAYCILVIGPKRNAFFSKTLWEKIRGIFLRGEGKLC